MSVTAPSVLAFLVHPGLLALGGALAAVPIIIHLLNRRRVRPIEWAAMDWLRAAMKRHQRRLRMEHWLMLLLRMAAIVLLGLALARPVLTDSALAGTLGGKRSLYLVLDNSYSTEAKVDARSVFERVRQEADRLLGEVGPDDAVTVVLTNDPYVESDAGTAPFVLQPRTVGTEGAARARQALQQDFVPRHAPAAWVEALRVTLEQMAPEDVNRQVVVLTDLQAIDWVEGAAGGAASDRDAPADPGAASEAPDTSTRTGSDLLRRKLEDVLRAPAAVRLVDVGGASRRNLAVSAIEIPADREPFAGRPLRLSVTVANHGTKAVRGARLVTQLDGTSSQHVTRVPEIPGADVGFQVPRPGTTTLQVEVPRHDVALAGPHIAQVSIEPPQDDQAADLLGRDSSRWLAFDLRAQVRIVALTDTSTTETQEEAQDYLRGVFEGDMPGSDSTGAEGSLPWHYRFTGVQRPDELLRLLRERADERVDLVVLANVVLRDEALVAELRDFVREGGGLMVFAGDRLADPGAINDLVHTDDPSERLAPYRFDKPSPTRERSADEAPYRLDLRERAAAHPLALPFTGAAAEEWIKRYPPKIWGRMVLRAPVTPSGSGGEDAVSDPLAPRAEVVLGFDDDPDAAAVVAGSFGEGRTLWIATSIDNGWLDEALLFRVVLLEEAALWLTRARSSTRTVEVGTRLRARVPRDASSVRLSVPGGLQVTPAPRFEGSTQDAAGDASADDEPGRSLLLDYVYDAVGSAGPWDLSYQRTRFDGESESHTEPFAVNVDPREGMLLAADPERIRAALPPELDLQLLTGTAELIEEATEGREGEITRLLLWGLLGLLLLESLLGLWFGRRSQRGAAAPEEATS